MFPEQTRSPPYQMSFKVRIASAARTIDVPAWLTERKPMQLDQAFSSLPGANEHTSAMDRAQALRVRLVPFALTWAVLAVIVGVIVFMLAKNAPAAALVALLAFSALTAYSYYRLNRTDYDYSREGTERYKVGTAADLLREQMQHEHELREMALRAYLKHLEQTDDRR